MREQWKEVVEFPAYSVSSLGRVKRGSSVLRPFGREYLQVCLSHKSKRHFRYVHRLVLTAFQGPCPSGKEALHRNGLSKDNALFNLRWGTRSENALDVTAHGRRGWQRGARMGSAKLTDAKAYAIKSLYSTGSFTQRQLGKIFRVHHSTIGLVTRRQQWRHVE